MNQKLATAEWAEPEAFAEQHTYAPGKFWLGRSPVNGKPLGYDDDRHVCLVSGSRSGKGTTTIVPNLCLWPGSIVVVDPKGENATVTAARRGNGGEHCEGMGQAVYVLDPFGAAQVGDDLRGRFNPLDALDANDPRTIDDAGRLADAIVVMNPESNDPFWDQSARAMVKALILHVLTFPLYEGRRNLNTVRQLIARGDHEGVELLRSRGKEDVQPAQALLWYGLTRNPAFNGVIAGTGDSLLDMYEKSPKQFQSVLQVANRNTEFLDSPGMQACVETSDFKLSDLKTDPKGVSIYLSLPQRYMGEHFRWLRMMITLTMNEMEATPGQPASGHRVLMCLDEFAGLKRLEAIENAVAQIAGYGVKLFFVLQSLEQLKATYKDGWETFLANSGLNLFYGIGDHFTREHVSKMIGDTELIRMMKTANETTGESVTHNKGSSSSSNWGENQSTGQSTGGYKSDNWKDMPFFLRNTAWFFSALIGSRSSSGGNNWGKNQNTGSSIGGGISTNESTSHSANTSQTTGENESLHKRPLITPDEIGRYFGRIDDKDDPVYPGYGLTVLSSSPPCPVQRVNYFEDHLFTQKHAPHPDHKSVPIVEKTVDLIPYELASLVLRYSPNSTEGSDFISIDKTKSIPCQISHGEIIAKVRVGSEGDNACFEMRSPCDGNLLYHNNFTIIIETFSKPDDAVISSNLDAVAQYGREELEKIYKSNQGKKSHDIVQIASGIACAVMALVCLAFAWSWFSSGSAERPEWNNRMMFLGSSVLFLMCAGATLVLLPNGITNLMSQPEQGRDSFQRNQIDCLKKMIKDAS